MPGNLAAHAENPIALWACSAQVVPPIIQKHGRAFLEEQRIPADCNLPFIKHLFWDDALTKFHPQNDFTLGFGALDPGDILLYLVCQINLNAILAKAVNAIGAL